MTIHGFAHLQATVLQGCHRFCRIHTIHESDDRLAVLLRPEGLGAVMYRVLDFRAAETFSFGRLFFWRVLAGRIANIASIMEPIARWPG